MAFKSLPKEDKATLRPYASILEDWGDEMDRMTEEQLHAIVRAAGRVSDTNCAWSAYQVAPLVSRMASQEIGRRAYLKEKASAHSTGCDA